MRLIADLDQWQNERVIFSPADESLTVDGCRKQIDRRSAALLLALIEKMGAPVSKDELMARAWPDRVLHENSIAKAISKLRAALDGSGLEIATVHGFGYRLKEGPSGAAAPSVPDRSAPHRPARDAANGQRRRAMLAAAGVLIAGLAIAVWSLTDRSARDAPRIPVRTAPPVTNDPPASIGTVLWVDDHPENNTLDVRFLRSRAVAVHLARSTEEARRLLAINRYDLVISDLGRGEDRLAGTKLAKQIRADGSDVALIIYTLRPDDAARQRAQRELIAESGASDLALTPHEIREKALSAVRGSR